MLNMISTYFPNSRLHRTVLSFALTICIGAFSTLHAQTIFALSGNNLVSFNALTPAMVLSSTAISGLEANYIIAGMDFRPATGALYILGYRQTTGEARLYTLNTSTGVATAIGAGPITLASDMVKVGFDFNPTVDRIRVTGSSNVNYRLHPVTGALVATDGNLAFALTDVNVGKNPSVGAVAYTNSYIGATSTTLYNFDDSLGVLTTQIPPNNGTLNTVGAVGILLNPNNESSDIDISINPVTGQNVAYLVAGDNVSLSDRLYTVNLNTGLASLVGPIGLGLEVDDIAVLIERAVPEEVTGQLVYALTANNSLISFDSELPGVVRDLVAVSGIAMGQVLVGMDFRPATGELFALGYNNATGEARLYTIAAATGVATAIGAAAITLEAGMGKIGFDFNPTVDRIRVTGSNNANYRLNPITGGIAATDADLVFATGDLNETANPSIGAVAYTNSYIGATSTVLYNYDDSLNVLTTQFPPNNGTLNTIGNSGLTLNLLDPSADMDIFFDTASSSNLAFLSSNTGALLTDNFYSLNLMSGSATLIGKIGLGIAINDIAVLIERVVPEEVTGQLVYALTANNSLISFDSDLPEVVRNLVAVSGIAMGQVLVGMDFRPATGELFALGYNNANGEARLYNIDRISGVATAIGAAPVTLALGTGDVGFDFNPTVDRIRVVGANNANYRMHPVTGAIAATDMNLVFAPGDVNAGMNPAVGAVAYTNSFNGATTTTLYNYDDSLNVLTTQIPPNNGVLNTLGSTGIVVNPADPSVDFDIYYNFETGMNDAYLSANPGAAASDNFYTMDLAAGSANLVGKIGNGIAVRDIAILIDSVLIVSVNDPLIRSQYIGVFPNPAPQQALFSFELNQSADIRMEVTDLSGRRIATVLDRSLPAGTHQVEWNVAAQAEGMYFVQMFIDRSLRGTAKVLVQRSK